MAYMDYVDLAVRCPQKGRQIQSITHSLTCNFKAILAKMFLSD